MNDIRVVTDWLADGARSAVRSEDVLRELCERMVGCGIPLWRAAVFVNTLHPDVLGRRFIWHAQSGVSVSEAAFGIVDTDDFRSTRSRRSTPTASRSGAASRRAMTPAIFHSCASSAPTA